MSKALNILERKLGSEGKSSVELGTESNVISAKNLTSKLKGKKVVLFAGAGFSMAWNSKYPSGYKLFSVDNIEKLKKSYNFFSVAPLLCIKEPQGKGKAYEKDCIRFFKEIKFHLDIYKRYPSLLPNYLDKTIVYNLEREIIDFVKNRFVSLTDKVEFDIEDSSTQNENIKNIIVKLMDVNSSLSFITTNYDFIFEKIFNDSDVTIVRGVIDKRSFANVELTKPRVSLFKINGGFDVFKDNNGFYIDHADSLSGTPNIILPSQEQNYDNNYFKSVFTKSANKLRDADILIFVGYSLPNEDHTIRFLLKNFLDSEGCDEKEVFIISKDLTSALETYPNVASLFPSLDEKEAVRALDGDLESLLPHLS
ncbi:SIR2 family protein [Vibrio campbellii]|uniref:SIR2 family protein n=1 Tax=Vibrio campbellii TaxID=680 RepID=UPI0038CD1859|nr:SIR2 family protein [Vibrio campbellii]